jgi:protein TonB
LEIKKTHSADIENKRATNFLLGLILVFAMMYVGFEYTSRPSDNSNNDETLDDMSQDIEMMPAMDTKDMIAAAPTASSPSITEKLKAVDAASDLAKKLSPLNGDITQGVGGTNDRTIDSNNDNNETTALSPVAVDNNDNPLNFRVVEKLPEFPGGMVEFMKWLTRNLKYPAIAQQHRLQGKVVVSFIINKDGSIVNVKIEQSVDPMLDSEALRVVRMMPKWKPGIEKNKPCRTMFAIPINFKL